MVQENWDKTTQSTTDDKRWRSAKGALEKVLLEHLSYEEFICAHLVVVVASFENSPARW